MPPTAPRLLIPRTPPMPVPHIRRPQIWSLKTCFDPTVRSINRMLRCLRADVLPESDGSVVVVLDLKYYEINPSPKSCVKLLLGNVGVTTFIEPADCGDGITCVAGILPIVTLKEGAPVALEVLTDNIIRDRLTIGIVQVVSVQSAVAELRRERTLPVIPPPKENYACCLPVVTEKDDKPEYSHEVPMEEDSILPKEIIPPDYQRLWLRVVDDVNCMTEKWEAAEVKAGRRLVRFWREQDGSLVKIRFSKHPPLEYFNEKVHMVISCIKLPDRSGHFVTSFDIVKLAEFILDLSLNTDMKNRARRNMALVPCKTLPRSSGDEGSQGSKAAAFDFLMRFGDPKPRSIEKSIKVYAWSCLEQCLHKILQRFIIHLPDVRTEPLEFEHQLEAVNKWKKSQRTEAMSTRPTKTRRESRAQAYERQEDRRVRPLVKLAQAPDSQPSRHVTPSAFFAEPPIKQEEDTPPAFFKKNPVEARDQKEPALGRIQTRQALRLQIAETPLGPTTPAMPMTPSPIEPVKITKQSSPSSPIHPPLQRDSSSNSLTVPHHGWTKPSSSDYSPSAAPSPPTVDFGASLASYSPAQGEAPSPRFYLFKSDESARPPPNCAQDLPSASSSSSSGYSMSPGTSQQGMSTASTIFTPNWPSHPHLGVYVHPSMADRGYCEESPVELPTPNMELHHFSHPGTPSLHPDSPVFARDTSAIPSYSQYDLERAQMLQLQMNVPGYPVAQEPKEDFKDIDTDEWLDNDYITAQENNHDG